MARTKKKKIKTDICEVCGRMMLEEQLVKYYTTDGELIICMYCQNRYDPVRIRGGYRGKEV